MAREDSATSKHPRKTSLRKNRTVDEKEVRELFLEIGDGNQFAFDRLQEILDIWFAENPKDKNLHELHLASVTLIGEGLSGIEEFVENFPNSDRGYYFLAREHWYLRNKERSLAYLRHAIELNPGEQRYRRVYRSVLAQPNYKPGMFPVEITFNW